MPWPSFFKSNDPPAPEWEVYLQNFASPFSNQQTLEEVSFVVLDLETTGLNSRKDRMLSLGAIRVDNLEMKVGERMEYFVRQESYSPNQSIGIHGIMPGQAAAGIEEDELLKKLLLFLGRRVIVGHHIGFDVAILNRAMKRVYGKPLQNKVIDTVQLVRKWDSLSFNRPHRNLGLDEVCRRWNIPLHERHTAAGDAFLTAILFLKLCGKLQVRGTRTLGALLRT